MDQLAGHGPLKKHRSICSTDRIEKTIPIRISLDETLHIGEDTGTLVSEDYKVPFRFTGEIEKVTLELK